MPAPQVNQMLAAAAAACEDKKAEDIRILALDPAESGLTDYFLICNGTNDRQNVAITDEIELRLKREFATYPNSVEGRRHADWILMDYVDFIVHVFSHEKRAFYGLERLRKSATTLSIADLNSEIKQQIAAGRKKKPVPTASIAPAAKKRKKRSALLTPRAPRKTSTPATAKKTAAAHKKSPTVKKKATSAAPGTATKSPRRAPAKSPRRPAE
jgi:ribosome-associated protein